MELILHNINKSYGKKIIIKDVSLKIGDKECVALIGPNGAGKTTIMKMINGITECDSGEISLNNEDINHNRDTIGYLSQYQSFYDWMTIEETLHFMGGLSGIKKVNIAVKIPELLKTVGLAGKNREKIKNLSGGMRQRVGIAQAILHEPDLLILDEPVSALDPIGRREIINLITKIKSKMSILISTHILSDAEEFCDRFLILKEGKLISDITMDEVDKSDKKSLALELADGNTEVLNKIIELDYVEDVKRSNRKIIIKTENIHNKFDLINFISSHKIDYKSIEVHQENLEEKFMNMVCANE